MSDLTTTVERPMSINPFYRAKLLYLMKVLMEKSDENHPMTVNDLIAELATYGIPSERKAIYTDMDILTMYGLDATEQIAKIAPGITGGEERSFLKVHRKDADTTPDGEKIIVKVIGS